MTADGGRWSCDIDGGDPPAGAPALMIRLELEAAPVVLDDCESQAEADRLSDWLNAHPALLALVLDALELEEAAA